MTDINFKKALAEPTNDNPYLNIHILLPMHIYILRLFCNYSVLNFGFFYLTKNIDLLSIKRF